MRMSNLNVDHFGRLAVRGIHDATVGGFRYIESGAFELQLLGVGNERRSISLHRLCKLGMRDVVNGTIISDIYCWYLRDAICTSSVAREAWKTLLACNYVESELPTLINSLRQQFSDCVLVFFESSYGGSIASICHEIFTSSDSD